MSDFLTTTPFNSSLSRRSLVALSGGVALAGLAGCTGTTAPSTSAAPAGTSSSGAAETPRLAT